MEKNIAQERAIQTIEGQVLLISSPGSGKAGKNGNLCVVGDDDQSIYGFCGALPVIMMDFKKDYPAVCEISMNINYRSKPEIITAAKKLIEHNTERFSKDIKAARDGHGEVIYKTLTDRKEELDYLSTTISCITAIGANPAKIAILATH